MPVSGRARDPVTSGVRGEAAVQAMAERGVKERTRSEAQAGDQVQAGDPRGTAFAQLYEAHRESTFRFLLGLLGERGLAEDALQDAWLQVHQHLDRYDSERPFKPWLHTVVRHAGLNALRARRKAPLVDDDPEHTASRASNELLR